MISFFFETAALGGDDFSPWDERAARETCISLEVLLYFCCISVYFHPLEKRAAKETDSLRSS